MVVLDMKLAAAIFAVVILALGLWLVFAQNPSEQLTIKVGDLPVVHGIPFYLAIEKGYFKDAGLNVERVKFEAPNQIIDALLQGQIQFGAPSIANGITGIANYKNPGKLLVYALSGGTAEHPNENLLVPIDSNISSIAELKGKKLGILAGTIQWRTITRHLLAENGLDFDKDVTIVELSSANQVPALASKQIDALIAIEPMPTIAILKGVGKILVKGPAEKVIADPLWAGAGVVSAKFAIEHPVETQKFIAVMNRAINEVNANPDAARQYLKGYTPLDDSLVSKAPIPLFRVCKDFSQSDIDAVEKFYAVFTKFGVVDGTIDFAKMNYCK